MKRTNYIAAVAVFFLLISSGIYLSQTTAAAPSTTLATGDHFVFDTDFWESRTNDRYFEMVNSSNTNQPFRMEVENQVEDINGYGTADVNIIRNDANTPDLPPVDTLLMVNSMETLDTGSYRNGSRAVWGDQGSPTWYNETYPTEDLSGQTRENRDQEPQMLPSNSTYTMIFPEMVNDTMNFPFYFPDYQFDFDGLVPLDYRSVTSGADWLYDINGAQLTLNVTEISSQFYRYYEKNETTTLKLGDQNDPNAPQVNVNVTLWIEIFLDYYHVFDNMTGIPLEVDNYSLVSFGIEMWGEQLYDPNVGDFDLTSDFSVKSESSHNSMISEASSFYGNDRPVSSGDNRIKEGDQLQYNLQTERWGNLYRNVVGGDPNTPQGWNETVQQWQHGNSSGTMFFDVFRHQPGMFESVVFYDGLRYGEYSYSSSRIENGAFVGGDSGGGSSGPEQDNFIDVMQFQSSATQEIMAFFDDNRWIEDPFQCDGPDCGGDGFYPNYPRELVKTAPVNNTDFYINLLTDDETDPFVINGYTYYEFNVSASIQKYGLDWTGIIQIPLGDGPDAMWVDANAEVHASGEQGFYYDSDTGAMVVLDQQTRFDVHIWGSWSVEFDPMNNPGVFTDVSVEFKVSGGDSWFMQLSEHPYLYQSQPTMPETTTSTTTTTTSSSSTTTDTSSSSSSTTSTTPTDTNSTSDTGSATTPELNLPLPIVPVLGSIATVVTIVRIRRKN